MSLDFATDLLELADSAWDHAGVARSDSADPRLAPVMAALAALARAETRVVGRRAELGKAVADAITAGVRPSVLVKETGKSAETIRQMARENGIEPLKEPTTTSIRKIRADLLAAGWDSDEAGRPTKPRHPEAAGE
jgi:hypothetical protein